jgi:hypothetical protein
VRSIKLAAAAVCLLLIGGLVAWTQSRCVSSWVRWGIKSQICPAGTPRGVLSVESGPMERGEEVALTVRVSAQFVDEDGQRHRAALPFRDADLSLRLGDETIPVACEWTDITCRFALPELADGAWTLAVHAQTRLPQDPALETTLELFEPAVIDVLTDRPLYEPGDPIRFRALALDARRLTPTTERPGTWTITDAKGSVVFVEQDATGPWGIADSSFPLAHDAPEGNWTLQWRSGQQVGTATVEVRTHTLPRLRLDASTSRPWYGIDAAPTIHGSLSLRAGSAARDATVRVTVLEGRGPDRAWPPPTAWMQPHEAKTDAEGTFSVALAPIPQDLRRRVSLTALVEAVDQAGERVSARVPLVLSPDPIAIEAVTEARSGLFANLSNRVYLRLTDPAGRVLADREISVTNRWDPRAGTQTARTDADGVASLQLDPGEPVNLLVPPPPLRQAPKPDHPPALALDHVSALMPEQTAAVETRRAFVDAARHLDTACGWRVEAPNLTLRGVRATGGRIVLVTPSQGGLDRCIADALTGRTAPDGVYVLGLSQRPSRTQPHLVGEVMPASPPPAQVETLLEQAALEAGRCVLGRDTPAESSLWLHWSIASGDNDVRVRVSRDAGWPEARCIGRYFAGLDMGLEDGSPESAQGALKFSVVLPDVPVATELASGTTRRGFEHVVEVGGLGTTNWVATVATAPNLRLRPAVGVVAPGDELVVQALRGPGHRGDLPAFIELVSTADQATVRCYRTAALAADVDDHDPTCPPPRSDGRFVLPIPDDAHGIASISSQGAQASVLIIDTDAHQLDLSVDRRTYAPGETAHISVQTGSPAVVSLTGVDGALGALTALPAPTALVSATLRTSARGALPAGLDALALMTGQVRGDAAAQAVLARITANPRVVQQTPPTVQATMNPPLDLELQTALATMLQRVHARVNADDAPVTYASYAGMWAAEAAHVKGPFGRELTLDRLPDALVRLANPRLVVDDATRLPEDIEPWLPYIRTQQ